MSTVTLSWVVTTRNKFPFLKEVLHRLLSNLLADEEIIVVDGASTDGTFEYLTELHRQGLIHQFLSEPDHGEAEGFNKGMLMANGLLIKIITDDDAFYLPGIRRCKEYMLSNPHIDLIGTEGAGTDWSQSVIYWQSAYHIGYQEWGRTLKPFNFSGLGIMLRKKSLPLLGLFHTGMVWVDAEYTLRTTSGKAQITWYTGRTWVRILNPRSNAVVYTSRLDFEGEKMHQFYAGENLKTLSDREILALTKQGIGTNRFDSQSAMQKSNHDMQNFTNENITRIFEQCDAWLTSYNQNDEGDFLVK